ncbi:MAG TPA: hypothetical protein PK014_05875 [Thermoanaerobaculia bacterium]|nr:hypothetical protein [Thermoanaerobaculia bacterium]HUM29624.1 hypothetical protein [Thermoanaerobaculia bacterium]HXK67275.1 hypothetical protein [Thermoanaerobaculia bacterium]
MMASILSFFLLASLTPRQDVYLLKQILPEATTVLLFAEKPDTNPDVAQYVIAAPPYNISLVPVQIPSIRKASEIITNSLVRYDPQAIILTDEKIFADPMLLRLVISQTMPKSIPVLVKTEKQVEMGATFTFSSQEDGKIVVSYNPVSVEKLKITLPKTDSFILKQVGE